MNVIHYIGLDVHKKTISYCIKTAAGQIVKEGTLAAERAVLRSWAGSLPQPWCGAMEATIFSAWIYDTLKAVRGALDMGHPAKMKAITAGKKKSDSIDARTIAFAIIPQIGPSQRSTSPTVLPFSPRAPTTWSLSIFPKRGALGADLPLMPASLTLVPRVC